MKRLTNEDPETKTTDSISENIAHLKGLFPEVFTEGRIDFESLKQILGDTVDEREERYGLNWHGKRRARQLALTPSSGTLRPCPEESVDWDTTKNLMIEGDNLEVLKLLQKSYAGKVKLIYIDPPYNTGKDFVYPDDYQDNIKNYLELTGQTDESGRKITSNTEASGRFHTDWLNMLYPRLKIARSLLTNDGVIFISIDDKELNNLRIICNEIFGEECFVALLVILCNPKGRSQDKYFATNHEYILIFSKKILPKGYFSISKEEDQIEEEYKLEDELGKYRLLELRNTHREYGKHNRKNLHYPFYLDKDEELGLEMTEEAIKILPNWDDGYEGCWTWDKEKANKDFDLLVPKKINGEWKIYRKSYANGADKMLKTIIINKSFYTEKGQKEFNKLFETKSRLFQSPKSPFLLANIFKTITSGNDLVLDFFAGSGTTGHAIFYQNAVDYEMRRYILVQLPEPMDPEVKEQEAAVAFCRERRKPLFVSELTKERLRRVGQKLREENSLLAGDLGFRVFKLDSTNIRAWDPDRTDLAQSLLDSIEHIKPDRTEKDILYELLLKLGLDLATPIEERNIAGKVVHSVGVGTLIVCLESDISDSDIERLALGIAEWHKEQAPAGETTVVFRDSAFTDDVAKTNLSAILEQHGLEKVRSL